MKRDSTKLPDLDDIALPHPREESLHSVQAASEYIQEHPGATKADIVESLEPEKNHRIGIHAAQALGKLRDVAGYRNWWWQQVVEPGLAAIPTIESPETDGGRWRTRSSDEPQNTERSDTERIEESQPVFDSVVDIQDVVAEGVLFELAYLENGAVTRQLVSVGCKVRPSALPIDSPPTFRFEPIVGSEEIHAPLPGVVDLRPVSFEHIPDPLSNRAIAVIVATLQAEPDRVPPAECSMVVELEGESTPAEIRLRLLLARLRDGDAHLEEVADRLFDLLNRTEGAIGERALETLHRRAAMDPSTVEPYVSDLSTLADDSAYPALATQCLATIAEEYPASVVDAVPSLAAIAESASERTRRWVFYTFTSVAKTYPEELLPALDVLISAIADDDEKVRTNALSAVGRIAGSYPDAAAGIVDDVAELLDSEAPMVRANAAGLLGDIAQERPAAVVEHASEIAPRLVDDDAEARHNASIALLEAGEANPAAIRDEVNHLATALGDDDPVVRANACSLAGNSGADVPLDRLAHLSREDPDESVRERASWALKRLG